MFCSEDDFHNIYISESKINADDNSSFHVDITDSHDCVIMLPWSVTDHECTIKVIQIPSK